MRQTENNITTKWNQNSKKSSLDFCQLDSLMCIGPPSLHAEHSLRIACKTTELKTLEMGLKLPITNKKQIYPIKFTKTVCKLLFKNGI